MSHVRWRGVTVDDRTAAMLNEADKLLGPNISFEPTQGSYSTSVDASAGTHSGGGAVDIHVSGFSAATIQKIVQIMREVGFAAWHRLPSEGPWGEHVHAIAIGCKDLSAAAAHQVQELKAGQNGLANHHADTYHGPKVSIVTWEQYEANKKLIPWPGLGAFVIGHSNPAVTQLGTWLIAAGFNKHFASGHYTAGPLYSTYDRLNVIDFQKAQGWDADGNVGPLTWSTLQTVAHSK